MPLIYTDHKRPQALEQELRELWRRLDALVMAGATTTTASSPASPAASKSPAATDVSLARMFLVMGG